MLEPEEEVLAQELGLVLADDVIDVLGGEPDLRGEVEPRHQEHERVEHEPQDDLPPHLEGSLRHGAALRVPLTRCGMTPGVSTTTSR